MKVFISYRRGDTAGRAGRLFDVLVTRLGAQNVFQDVDGMSPGSDFREQITDEIATSDAVLVVIGPDWLTISAGDGVRRLDQPDDLVRGEIVAALAASVPVVPVLVGDAQMPTADDLPVELRPLVDRHAARVRDESWHQDVDGLVRRLEGSPVRDAERRRAISRAGTAAALVVMALLVVVGAVWVDRRGGRDDDPGDADPEPRPCAERDDSWQPIALGPVTAWTETDTDARTLRVTVRRADVKARAQGDQVVVSMLIENVSTDPEAEFYLAVSDFGPLYLDEQVIGSPSCFSGGPRPLDPGEFANIGVGFDGTYESDSSLVLETNLAGIDVTIADP